MDIEKKQIITHLKESLPNRVTSGDMILERQSEGPQWVQYRIHRPGHPPRYFEVKIMEHY